MANMLENGRAQFAFEQVQEAAGKSYAKEYRSLVRELPIMILTNGFGTTIAFLYSKKNNKDNKMNEHQQVYTSLMNWLIKQGLLEERAELMEVITKLNRDGYKQMMRETMSFLHWVKRFAEGMIGK